MEPELSLISLEILVIRAEMFLETLVPYMHVTWLRADRISSNLVATNASDTQFTTVFIRSRKTGAKNI
jgi:hypothetical protein